jgi:pimeloyl-ACP methyl ester carboxylesterase
MKTLSTVVLFFLFVLTSFAQPPLQKDTAYSFDDVPIVYQKAGNGNQVLVFVHGWSCDKSYWRNQIEFFAKKCTVIEIDLAGCGESGLSRKDWTIENYGKDVKAVVEKENLNNVILIGHSMGGDVIETAAVELGDKVKALIGIDTFQEIETPATDEQVKSFTKSFEENFHDAAKNFVKRMFYENADSNLVEMISEDMASAPPEVAIPTLKAAIKFNEAILFDKINIPVRFLNSDHYPTNIEAAKRHIKDFDIKEMKGVGHFLMLEKPEEFNKLLEGTINELELE